MTAFVLVHGAWHGAWCFDDLGRELEARGHTAVAVDLPASDVTAGNAAYAEVIAAAVPSGDAVVVGHSLAGLALPLVAVARPVGCLVYLCALVPEPGRSLVDRLRGGEPIFVEGFAASVVRDAEGRSSWPDRAAAIHDLYDDCPSAAAEAAFARLRPQARLPNVEPCPLEALPDVRTVSVLATGDRCVSPAWSRVAARARLGVDPVELAGGHSPMLARPAELAAVLESI